MFFSSSFSSNSSLLPCGAYRFLAESGVPRESGDLFREPLRFERSFDASSGAHVDTFGCAFRQLAEDVPSLAPLYHPAELAFSGAWYTSFAAQYMWLPFVICAAYLAFLYFGTRAVAASGVKLKLYGPMIAWNTLLATFSAVGFLRTAPHLIYYTYMRGPYATVSSFACHL